MAFQYLFLGRGRAFTHYHARSLKNKSDFFGGVFGILAAGCGTKQFPVASTEISETKAESEVTSAMNTEKIGGEAN